VVVAHREWLADFSNHEALSSKSEVVFEVITNCRVIGIGSGNLDCPGGGDETFHSDPAIRLSDFVGSLDDFGGPSDGQVLDDIGSEGRSAPGERDRKRTERNLIVNVGHDVSGVWGDSLEQAPSVVSDRDIAGKREGGLQEVVLAPNGGFLLADLNKIEPVKL
jgi:hypothetical protein